MTIDLTTVSHNFCNATFFELIPIVAYRVLGSTSDSQWRCVASTTHHWSYSRYKVRKLERGLWYVHSSQRRDTILIGKMNHLLANVTVVALDQLNIDFLTLDIVSVIRNNLEFF